jgi:hypothetical protein
VIIRRTEARSPAGWWGSPLALRRSSKLTTNPYAAGATGQIQREPHQRDDEWLQSLHQMSRVWRQACEGAGLAQLTSGVLGPSMATPELYGMSLDGQTLRVRLLPGQLPADVIDVADRLAPALGAARLRVVPQQLLNIKIELLADDPLAAVVHVGEVLAAPQLIIGISEVGQTISLEPPRLTHISVQGITGSGKSVWTYRLLTQLASYREVLLTGIDPSGLLFRPFAGSRHADWQVSGVADPDAFTKLLRRLVDEMDHRIRTLPVDRDEVDISRGLPLVVVILEEIAGLYRVCDQHDKDLGKLIRSLIARLLAEGRKAGFRVLMIVQRAEAAVIGAFERAQCATKISFGVDSMESIKLLHPAAELSECKIHLAALPGVALLSAPGIPLMRFRAEYIGTCSDYCGAVIAACVQAG